MNKKIKKILITVLSLVLISIFLFFCIQFITSYYKNYKKAKNGIGSDIVINQYKKILPDIELVSVDDENVDYGKYTFKYKDIIFHIEVEHKFHAGNGRLRNVH